MNGIKEKSKRNILIAIIVILAVAIIGIGVGLVYNNFFAGKPEEPGTKGFRREASGGIRANRQGRPLCKGQKHLKSL